MLGKGACREIRLGFRVLDSHRVAIKIICKRTTITTFNAGNSSSNVLNEVRILQSVNHPCVINLKDVIDTPNFLFIVLELAEGRELFDKIIEKTKLNEAEAKLHFFQIASAIKYLHFKKIFHRDPKPENLLLYWSGESLPIVKITDMGMSMLVVKTRLKTFCGTAQNIAPEVLQGAGLPDSTYNLKVDCWSLGLILYILLAGCCVASTSGSGCFRPTTTSAPEGEAKRARGKGGLDLSFRREEEGEIEGEREEEVRVGEEDGRETESDDRASRPQRVGISSLRFVKYGLGFVKYGLGRGLSNMGGRICHIWGARRV